MTGVHDDVVCHLGDERQVCGHEDHGEAELLAQLVEQSDDLLLDGDASRAVVGSSAMTELGSRVRAMAMNALALAARELVCG